MYLIKILLSFLFYGTIAQSASTIQLERPWTTEEIAKYKATHPDYYIDAETYKEATIPESLRVAPLEPHAAWTDESDTKAVASRSENANKLEQALKERRATKIIQKSGRAMLEKKRLFNKKQKSKVSPSTALLNLIKLTNSSIYEDMIPYYLNEIKKLLNNGADPNFVDALTKKTLLSLTRLPEVTQLLIDAGADINKTSGDQDETPLFENPNLEQIRILLKAGANPNAQDKSGKTPLMYNSSIKKAELLLLAGADPNITTQWHDETPLSFYIAQGGRNIQYIKLLIKHRAIIPEEFQTNSLVKQAVRELKWEKAVAKRALEIKIAHQHSPDVAGIIQEYAGL